MDVKEAVKAVKTLAQDFLKEETVSPFQLEEVSYDESDETWVITLGYYSKDIKPGTSLSAAIAQMQGGNYDRQYKIFRIRDSDGKFISMKIREISK